MQSVSSRIWTRVAVSISYDDNHYTTGITTRKRPVKTDSIIQVYVKLVIDPGTWGGVMVCKVD